MADLMDKITEHSDLNGEFRRLFAAGKDEFFEDGMESAFSRNLVTLIEQHGDSAIEILTKLIVDEQLHPEVTSEALRWIGRIEPGADIRRKLIERSLGHSSPQVRDGAALGLASMDDPKAIPSLKKAIAREPIEVLRQDMQQVLDQLLETQQTGKIEIHNKETMRSPRNLDDVMVTFNKDPAPKKKGKKKKAEQRPTPDVSVLMRIRNGVSGYEKGSMARALNSVLHHQPSIDVEVIAVNNGSTDKTGEWLAEAAETEPRLKVITLAENVGEAGALNVGCELATGRYCIQLTCRSWFEPDSLKHLVAVLDEPEPENDPRVGFAFGCMEVHGLHARFHRPPKWNLHQYTQSFLANFFMFRRDFYTECGCEFVDYLTLDNGAKVGICDRDFMMQMVYNCGANGMAVPEVKVINYHFTGDNQMSSVVAANRVAIDVEWRRRWGKCL